MGKSRIVAQMYTLREFTKTPEDIIQTLKKVKAMGYDAVQLSALGPIETPRLAQACQEIGLAVAATHEGYASIRDNMEATVAKHKALQCEYVAIGGIPSEYRNGEGYSRFAREASEVAKKLKAQGLIFGYHNHSFELEKFGDRTGLEILYSESDKAMTAEIDTYWIQHGGGDPAAWIKRVADRMPLVHLKDMTMKGGTQIMAEVGEGNLNWPAILQACKEAGTVWYIVEQDTCQRDPFESLAISLRNLKKMGLE